MLVMIDMIKSQRRGPGGPGKVKNHQNCLQMTEFQPSNRGRGDLIFPKHLKIAMFIIYYIYYTIDYHNILLLLLLSSSHPLYPKFHKIVFSTTYDILWFYSNYYVCCLVFFIQRVSKKARRRTSENQTMASLGTKPRLSHNSIIYPRGFIFIPQLHICHPYLLPSLSLSQNFIVVLRIFSPTTPSLTPKALFLSHNLSLSFAYFFL